MKLSSAYIFHSLIYYFKATAENIYVNNNSIVTLKCDYLSTTHSLIWLGPQNLVAYTDGEIINKNVSKFRRLSVGGDHKTGEYDLVIKDFTENDEGVYKCYTLNNGKTQEGTYFVKVKKPPTNLVIGTVGANIYRNRTYINEDQNITVTCKVTPGIPLNKLILLNQDGILLTTETHLIAYIFEARMANNTEMFTCRAIHECLTYPLESSIKVIVYTIPKVRIQVYPTTTPDVDSTFQISCDYSSNHPDVSFSLEQIRRQNSTRILLMTNKTFQINRLQRSDAGTYRCNASNPAGTGTNRIYIIVRYKPILLTKEEPQKFYTEVGLPVRITFHIESFERPTASWLSGTLHGKRGNWQVNAIDSRTYVLSSTVLPNIRDHFGTYRARIRNSAGMLNADIQLIQDKTPITVFPASIICNTSSAMRIACHLDDERFRFWESSWVHFRENTLIRYIAGILVKNVSILEIDFCDYQDEGNYRCTWSLHKRRLSADVFVKVHSEPIVTKKLIETNLSFVTLKVMFYSNDIPRNPIWYNNLNDELEEKEIVSSLTIVDIEMMCYGKRIKAKGYQASLIINGLAISNSTDLSCLLLNAFGRIETSFRATDIQEKINNIKIPNSNGQSSTKYRQIWTTESLKDSNSNPQNKMEIRTVYLYAIISGGVVLLLAILFTSSIVVILKIYKRGYQHTNAVIQSEDQINGGVTDNVYEDIDSSEIVPPSQEPYDEMINNENGPLAAAGIEGNTQRHNISDSLKDIHNYEDFELNTDPSV